MGILDGYEPRRSHVLGVGELAESVYLRCPSAVGTEVVAAAWLHDVGYAEGVKDTGFHPVDGANFLRSRGWDPRVCSLVAFHTGAQIEAEERGVSGSLDTFERPPALDLDMLTLFDLSVDPEGRPIDPSERIDEILRRYDVEEPVHRAIRRSGADLIESAKRAAQRISD